MMKKLLWWAILFGFIAILLFIAALFLTPSFTYKCTDSLLMCVEEAYPLPVFPRLWQTFVCVYHNVICVLGGLFI